MTARSAVELVQIQESSMDGHVWRRDVTKIVPASNRRQILDREAKRDIRPGPDGSLTIRRKIVPGTWHYTRIRWDDPRLYSPSDLALIAGNR
ncbi:hypothetical protein MYK68_16060 [Gordonia sp. PP30]|uniref:hypothetical protein n=1 Tax=Gordonia sp. PP30 TaxID=2935861 RepID=UPI001FFFFC65|nr:hypothetical protein [Gordonia sp. PP30]UQE74226.1 hypothetical protein MYK68_16060 [Gordonia sp. PP30]